MFRHTHIQINYNLIVSLEDRVRALNKADVTRRWTLIKIYILSLVVQFLMHITNNTKWMWPVIRIRVILRYLHEILDGDEEHARHNSRN